MGFDVAWRPAGAPLLTGVPFCDVPMVVVGFFDVLELCGDCAARASDPEINAIPTVVVSVFILQPPLIWLCRLDAVPLPIRAGRLNLKLR
jgi:hypothetical protein